MNQMAIPFSFFSGLLRLVLPAYLSDYVTTMVRSELGVSMYPETVVQNVSKDPSGRLVVTLNNGTNLEADHVGKMEMISAI